MKHDVIIIGAGMGGLACATLLTQAGRDVLVLEQGTQAGGAVQGYRRGDAVLDTGFHYVGGLGQGQSLRPCFEQLGLMQLPWHQLDTDGFDHVMIDGRDFRLACGFDAFVETLAQDFPHERAALGQYADLLRAVASGGPTVPTDLTGVNAYDYLCATFGNPLLRQVLSGAAMRLELRRESLPLHVFAHCQAPYVESSWRLRGDGGQVAAALVAQVKAGGGEVLCRSEVEQLVVRNGRVSEARCTNGGRHEADWFISSLHPATTCQLVSPPMRGVYPRRMQGLENTCGMLTVTLVLKPQSVRYFNYNQYVCETRPYAPKGEKPQPAVSRVMVSARVPEDGSAWTRQVDLLTTTPWTAWQQWDGTRHGRRGKDYVDAKNQLADACIRLAEQFLPGLSHHVASRYVSTPLTWRDYTRTPFGSAFGTRKDCRQPLLTMLSPRTPLPNLLLTGQSVGLHGLQGVTMTAFGMSPKTPIEVELIMNYQL